MASCRRQNAPNWSPQRKTNLVHSDACKRPFNYLTRDKVEGSPLSQSCGHCHLIPLFLHFTSTNHISHDYTTDTQLSSEISPAQRIKYTCGGQNRSSCFLDRTVARAYLWPGFVVPEWVRVSSKIWLYFPFTLVLPPKLMTVTLNAEAYVGPAWRVTVQHVFDPLIPNC